MALAHNLGRFVRGLGGAAIAAALAAGPLCVADARAQAPAGQAAVSPSELTVAVGKSQVITLPDGYTDLMIGDSKVADILPLNTRSAYVVGKSFGSTALTVYGPGKRLLAAMDIVVSSDVDGFKTRLHEILPTERDVSVRAANQSLILSGIVSSPSALHQILTLADSYSPGKVVNMLSVEGVQQVMLTVRFVEMERTTAKNLQLNAGTPGLNTKSTGFQSVTGDSFSGGNGSGSTSTGATTASTFGFLAAQVASHTGNFEFLLDALETKGLTKTLAEPNLVTMSGDTASFLAGGEFPIPIASSAAVGSGGVPTITVDFKQFGISLAFTPTILQDGLINMVVNPEVSSIDPTTAVNTGLVSVPGLKVRRAHTTVEVRDGESFTIAGLLSDNYQNNIRQFPFVGDLPILGALFRSTNFQKDQTELVIVVTPHLVVPRRGRAATPIDHFAPPSDFELFLLGAQRGSEQALSPEDRALISADPTKGGIDGPHGHILY